jgi:hypothetical protein
MLALEGFFSGIDANEKQALQKSSSVCRLHSEKIKGALQRRQHVSPLKDRKNITNSCWTAAITS